LCNIFTIFFFQALGNESVKSVRTSIAQLVGVIVKLELPTNSWPEVIHYVQQLVTSENMEVKEVNKIYTYIYQFLSK